MAQGKVQILPVLPAGGAGGRDPGSVAVQSSKNREFQVQRECERHSNINCGPHPGPPACVCIIH